MPTAAKLVAAVLYAIVGFFAAEAVKPQMPEGTQFGLFSVVVAAIGLGCGWMVMGRLAGRGYSAAVGSGVRTAVTIVFWGLLVFSIYEMLRQSMRMRYDGPMEALQGVLELMYGYGQVLLAPMVLGVLAVGGVLAALVTEWAKARWP
jgi:hypothetical protein